MTNSETPKWRDRKWWEGTFGVNRDEFTDSANREIMRWATWVTLITGLPIAVYTWWDGRPEGIWMLIILTCVAVWVGNKIRQTQPEDGVWDEYHLMQRELIYKWPMTVAYVSVFIAMFYSIINQKQSEPLWGIPMLITAFIIIPLIARRKVYPLRYWIFVIILTSFAAFFGYSIGEDFLPSWADWLIAAAFLGLMAYSYRYYIKQEV